MGDILYAWACPAFIEGFPMDHTWVTSYDNRVLKYKDIAEVIRNNGLYWFCWGDFHPKGERHEKDTGFLGSANGDYNYSSCICAPNLDSRQHAEARGTIYYYGVDGVCHQLANQILWSSASLGHPPLTVSQALGYRTTKALYGEYGVNVQDWELKKSQCSRPESSVDSGALGVIAVAKQPESTGRREMPATRDSFEDEASSILKSFHQEDKLDILISLRRAHQAKLMELRKQIASGKKIDASEINAMHNQFFRQVEKLIHPDAFQQLFGMPIETVANVVDQRVVDMVHQN
ncbi:hypothetical protein [Chromobacterium vaccinii]|uniref:hypothetical protein n=1 Tax=Chromobacterium vaccinii TaxID=1108595 RepID=UPI001E3FFA49|nr:hypothetical protein [Chromobacterium vaccinii]MCD4502390.1 hypothetical protein [Chromobacterium vaccinii]